LRVLAGTAVPAIAAFIDFMIETYFMTRAKLCCRHEHRVNLCQHDLHIYVDFENQD